MSTTFWKVLKNNKIEIPIIQRDYAQGREGKEHLRERFINELVNVLINKGEKSLELDFVYGSNENNKFIPLDGQQRLTTLWLLHWYIAYKSGNLKTNKDIFNNFTYETRVSSREFCKEMSEQEFKINNDDEKKKISDTIEKQTWFYNIWKQDPTINSMLRTLDTIEQVLIGKQVLYKELWEVLTEKSKISFIFYDMENFGLSDDLYIKMNARFKPLTNFENFKADLINYLKNENIDINEISKNLDTNWTDIFWKKREESTNEIDDIFFAFINRYLWVRYVERKIEEKIEKNDIKQKLNEQDEYKILLNFCITKDKDNVEYNSFDIYEKIIDFDTLKQLDNILKIYKETSYDDKTEKFIFENFVEYPFKNIKDTDEEKQDDFSFIPEYKKQTENDEQKVVRITQRQRMAFFGIIKFLTNFDFYDNEKDWIKEFKRWVRFVWNLVDDVSFRSEEQVITVIEKINGVFNKWQEENKKQKISIYEYLKDQSNFEKTTLGERFKEECEKAKQICEGKDRDWEKDIIKAEKFSFFHGTIRFLFHDENGETVNWNNFKTKYEQAENNFKINDDNDDYEKRKIYNFDFWKNFIYWISKNKGNKISDNFTFVRDLSHVNSTKFSWKNYLVEKEWSFGVHKMLMNKLEDGIDNKTSKRPDIPEDTILYYLCNTDLLKSFFSFIDKNKKYGETHRFIDGCLLYPKNCTYGINLNIDRQKLLNKLYKYNRITFSNEDIKLKTNTNDKKIEYFFYGWSIYFEYEGTKFKFGNKNDNNIYCNDEIVIEITDENIKLEKIKEKLDEYIRNNNNNN